jgi:anaerobic dimethyl sulfoxide reductase subunit C (anchor subunit)
VAAILTLLDVFPQADILIIRLYGALLCLLLIASLVCSTLHLGKPTKALRAFMRLGNSSVSNEVFVGALFAASLALYLIVSQSLAATGGVWKILLALVAALASLFIIFQCLAYRMRTVLTWNSFAFSAEFAIIALLGGVCAEGVLVCLAMPGLYSVRFALVAVGAICAVGMVIMVFFQGTVVSRCFLARKDAKISLKRFSELAAVRVSAVAVGSIIWGYGICLSEPAAALVIIGAIMVVSGILVGRYAFYRFYANVGLPRAE